MPEPYSTQQIWKKALASSEVRLQWDPDHSPAGGKVERRAIQPGLRGGALERYAKEWVVEIEDISSFVAAEYEHVRAGNHEALETLREDVYPIIDATRLHILADNA